MTTFRRRIRSVRFRKGVECMLPSRVCWSLSLVTVLVGWVDAGVVATSSPPPSWWGEAGASIEATFETASDWAKKTEIGLATTSRAWVADDGSWAIGVAVAKAEAGSEDDDSLGMVARERAMRAMTAQAASGQGLVDAASVASLLEACGATLKWTLNTSPRTRIYELDDRRFAMSIINDTQIASIDVVLDTGRRMKADSLKSLDWVAMLEAVPDPSEAARWIRTLKPLLDMGSSSGLRLVEIVSGDPGTADAAAMLTEFLNAGTPVDLADIERLDRLRAATGVDVPILEVLAVTTGDTRGRLDALAKHVFRLGKAGRTTVPTVIRIRDGGRGWRLAVGGLPGRGGLQSAETMEAMTWDAIRQLAGESTADRTMLAWSGNLLPTVADEVNVLGSRLDAFGPPMRLSTMDDGRVVVVQAAITEGPAWTTAGLEAFDVEEIEQSGSWETRRGRIARDGIRQALLARKDLPSLSSGVLSDLAEAESLANLGAWVVPIERGEHRYEVHLDVARLQELVREARLRKAAVTLVLGEMRVPDRILASAPWEQGVQEAVSRLASTLPDNGPVPGGESLSLAVHSRLELQPGEEPGAFGKPRPFVEPVTWIALAKADTGEPLLEASGHGPRVFGAHDPSRSAADAMSEAVGLLIDAIDADTVVGWLNAPQSLSPPIETLVKVPPAVKESLEALGLEWREEGVPAAWPGGDVGFRRFLMEFRRAEPSPSR